MLFHHFQSQIPKSQYLIAFSGGLDSTALLALFHKLRQIRPQLQLRAIHIHHGLSTNADYWAQHCQQICTQFQIPLIVEHVQVDDKNGVEQGAREARYLAIKKHRRPQEIVATAHHLQDQTETFFLALKRGSGLKGLGAMQSESTLFGMPICRPLLGFSRADLTQFVQAESLPWIEDESNADNRYDRNFLRNQILPELRQRWAHWDQAVARSANHCYEQQQLINELLTPEFNKIYRETDRTLSLVDFSNFSTNKQNALIRMWLEKLEEPMLEQGQLAQLLRDLVFARSDATPVFILGEKAVRRYQTRLYLTRQFQDVSPFKMPLNIGEKVILPDDLGEIELQKNTENLTVLWRIENQIYRAILSFTEQKITIRFGYSGKVKIHPQDHHRDIKKIWQNHGIPPWQRTRIPLIFYGEQLKSAVGFFENFA